MNTGVISHCLLILGVCYKQRRTMRNFENVYRYENSCKISKIFEIDSKADGPSTKLKCHV
jgi:hypothetical protein